MLDTTITELNKLKKEQAEISFQNEVDRGQLIELKPLEIFLLLNLVHAILASLWLWFWHSLLLPPLYFDQLDASEPVGCVRIGRLVWLVFGVYLNTIWEWSTMTNLLILLLPWQTVYWRLWEWTVTLGALIVLMVMIKETYVYDYIEIIKNLIIKVYLERVAECDKK